MVDCELCNCPKLTVEDTIERIAKNENLRVSKDIKLPPDSNQIKNLYANRGKIKDFIQLEEDFLEIFEDLALRDFVETLSDVDKKEFTTNVTPKTVIDFIKSLETSGLPQIGSLFHQAVRRSRLRMLEKLMTNENFDRRKYDFFQKLLDNEKDHLKPMMKSCDLLLLHLEVVNVISPTHSTRLSLETIEVKKLRSLIGSLPRREENWYELFILCLCAEGSTNYLTNVHPKLAAKNSDYENQKMCIQCIIHSQCEELYAVETNICIPTSSSRLTGATTSRLAALNVARSSSNVYMTDNNSISQSSLNQPSRLSSSANGEMEMDAATSSRDTCFRPNPQLAGDSTNDGMDENGLCLHSYQRDLCIEALRGENVLICSPTGSGKTYMAMYIIKKHLKSGNGISSGGKRRVIYVVQQSILVEQHYKTFLKHFPPDDLTKMYGKDKNRLGPCYDPPNRPIRVVISTAELIRNAMQEDVEKFWNYCSLLIFDEAHHCQKKTPYNGIMSFYRDAKYKSSNSAKLPQILGFTASPGTGNARNKDGALKHLFSLMGDLDCYQTAYLSYEDYHQATQRPAPSERMIAAPPRASDWFGEQVENLMKICEEKLKQLHEEGKIKNTGDVIRLLAFPQNRSQPPYMNALGQLEILSEIGSMDADCLKYLTICNRYLKSLHEALIIYHLARAKDACLYLESGVKSTSNHPFEKEIFDELKRIIEIIKETSENEDDNPCLNALKRNIHDHLVRENGSSRVLVFVKERRLCDFLKAAFEEEVQYDNLRAVGVIMGACNRNETNSVTTTNQQNRTLEDFGAGKIKILFSTAITEEGLNVPECKLIIRYAHVTNEIAMLQSKGRGRAENAEYILIYPEHEERLRMKEIKNQASHEFMDEAMKEFQKFSRDERNKRIKATQERRMHQLREGDEMENDNPVTTENRSYEFLCKGCSIVAFDASSLRRNDPHFVCSEDISARSRRETSKSVKSAAITRVYCKVTGCNQLWGEIKMITGIPSFQPDRTGFRVRCKETQEIVIGNLKKWSDVSKLFDVIDLFDT